ncbi:hypothetical protein VPH35_131025 [Triticum aestivum]
MGRECLWPASGCGSEQRDSRLCLARLGETLSSNDPWMRRRVRVARLMLSTVDSQEACDVATLHLPHTRLTPSPGSPFSSCTGAASSLATVMTPYVASLGPSSPAAAFLTD